MMLPKYIIPWNGELYEGVIYNKGNISIEEALLFTHALYWELDRYTAERHLEEWNCISEKPGWVLNSSNSYVLKKGIFLLMKKF